MTVLHVGADVAKASVESAAHCNGERCDLGEIANEPGAFPEWEKAVERVSDAKGAKAIHLILEPTGGYEYALMAFAYERGWRVTLVNPMHVRRWADGTGRRAKTDKEDARLLAEYGAQTQPAPQEPVDETIRQLDGLLRRRSDLEKLLRSERNRLGKAEAVPSTPTAVRQSIQRTVEALETEQQAMEDAIDDLVKRHPSLGQQRQLLLSVPGVGPKIVLPLLVLLHRFRALTAGQGSNKQLTAFLGLDPRPHVSGRTVYKRPTISKMGDRQGRTYLYMGALGGIGGKNVLSLFYHRLLGRGKAKKVALVACARKILIWSWAVLRHQSPFDPAHFDHLVEIAP